MKGGTENGIAYLEAESGKVLYNPVEGIYTMKFYSSKNIKLTDWQEVDQSSMIVTMADDELIEYFRSEIEASITIVRGRRSLTSTKVGYSYDASTHTITEVFS